jgi:hypothetical protein
MLRVKVFRGVTLEVIAIDPDACPPGRPRWFGLDDPGLRDAVRDGGRTECAGALPSLIEWQGPHPCAHLPRTELALQELELRGVPPRALDLLNLRVVQTSRVGNAQHAPLSATLD